MTFVNLKVFPSAVNALGLSSMFWIHSGICVFICIVAAMILPETRGKSLKELSELYEKKSIKHCKISPASSLPKEKEIEAQMA